MNPVPSLVPDLVRADFHTTWIYVVGPFVSALIGVAFEWILKGKPAAAGSPRERKSLGFRFTRNRNPQRRMAPKRTGQRLQLPTKHFGSRLLQVFINPARSPSESGVTRHYSIRL